MNQDVIFVKVNGIELLANRKAGVWTFFCERWPDIARDYDGATNFAPAAGEFIVRALAEPAAACA